MNLSTDKIQRHANSIIVAFTAGNLSKRINELNVYRWIPGKVSNICRILDAIVDQELNYGDTKTAQRIIVSALSHIENERPYLINNDFYIQVLTNMSHADLIILELIEKQVSYKQGEIIAGIPADRLNRIVENLYKRLATEYNLELKHTSIRDAEKRLYMPIFSLFNECRGGIAEYLSNTALNARLFTGISRLHVINGDNLLFAFFKGIKANTISERTASVLKYADSREVIANFLLLPTPELVVKWLPYLPTELQHSYATILRNEHENVISLYCPKPLVTDIDAIISLLKDENLVKLLSD